MLSDQQLLKYQRQIFLPQIDIAGQETLLGATVCVVGAGGLGAAVLPLLAGAGVGSIHLWDGDVVDESNLHRQTMFRVNDIGQPKATVAKQVMLQLNPDCSVRANPSMLTDPEQLEACDLIIDCTDNLTVRTLINRWAVVHAVPLVSGAATAMGGQVALYPLHLADAPCWQCVFPEVDDQQLNCREAGVLGPVVHIIGAMQAQLALLQLVGHKQSTASLHLFDGATMQWRQFSIAQSTDCPTHSAFRPE